MTLHQLRLFVGVADYGNVTRAAHHLHISQPALSRQLKLLEEECGVKLYKVNGHGIELTSAGQVFLKNVKPFLSQFENLKIFNGHTNPREEMFTIGGSYTPSASFLLSLISLFKKIHPKVQITLRTGSSQEIEKMVANSEVDLGFITVPSDLPLVSYESCHEDKVVVFASPKHPLAHRHRLTLEELAMAPLVVKRGPFCQAGLLKCLADRELKPNIVMECEFPQLVTAAVKNCMGLGMLYREAVKAELSEGNLKILTINGLEVKGRNFVAYKKGKSFSSNVNDFLDLVNKRMAKARYRPSSLEAA
jgi:DNA-binding transcriptional LysR family regulator